MGIKRYKLLVIKLRIHGEVMCRMGNTVGNIVLTCMVTDMTRFIVVISSQCIQMLNHCVIYKKLYNTACQLHFNKEKEKKGLTL